MLQIGFTFLHHLQNIYFEVFTVVKIHIVVFCVMTLCSLITCLLKSTNMVTIQYLTSLNKT